VADDLLILCKTTREARESYEWLRERLQAAGMPLKGTLGSSIHDLTSGQSVEWLGYHLSRKEEGLSAATGARAWNKLEEHLREAHFRPDPPLQARETIKGWVGYLGPCYSRETSKTDIARIRSMALYLDHEEVQSEEEIRFLWVEAQARWCQVLHRGRGREEDLPEEGWMFLSPLENHGE
jgi:hypothetical protein